MKIAVISDIHGNMQAMDAVMNDIKKRKCEKIFVLGDYAMAGPEPIQAVQYFMDKQFNSNYTMIQGNTDLMIADFNNDIYNALKEKAPIMAEALKNDSEFLNSSEKMFLKNLPAQLEEDIEGIKFLLTHGSPRKNNEDILPTTPIDEIDKMLVNVNADVVLCGHTHLPCGFQTSSKKTVVNVGSIGRPFTPEPKSCYLTIDVADGKCLFEHHFVSYDNNLASEILRKRKFMGADKLAGMLLNPRERHF